MHGAPYILSSITVGQTLPAQTPPALFDEVGKPEDAIFGPIGRAVLPEPPIPAVSLTKATGIEFGVRSLCPIPSAWWPEPLSVAPPGAERESC